MMHLVNIELPEEVFSVCSHEQLIEEMRLAFAVRLYQESRVSQGLAANIAGMDRTDFLLTLADMKVDSFQVDMDDLERELARYDELARGVGHGR